jgi:hypothetical protein
MTARAIRRGTVIAIVGLTRLATVIWLSEAKLAIVLDALLDDVLVNDDVLVLG